VNLPRVERILSCTRDQRVCKRCGKEAIVISYKGSSQLDVEPAKYFCAGHETRETGLPVMRRTWSGIGAAAILSIVESWRRLKLPARDYLAAVLPGFADLPI